MTVDNEMKELYDLSVLKLGENSVIIRNAMSQYEPNDC
jgi:hypothetical protein